jgi:peptide/nickel transport system ATP-binding protein
MRSTRASRGACKGAAMAAVYEPLPVKAPAPPPAAAALPQPLLEIADLKTWFFTRDGIVRAVDGVSFHVMPGETLAIVGESGCGKSVTALSILRLVPSPPGRIVSGAIRFAGRDLIDLSEAAMRAVRGNEISMVFQEPMTSLNPVLNIGRQIGETLTLHQGLDKQAALGKAIDMLRLVHIPEPERRIEQYPHQLSGGMRQRVMIAMALACNPRLLIADEPTTALDVTIQAQILDLMRELKAKIDAAIVLITHDLGVVAEMAQRVVVMYAGRRAEEAPVGQLFRHPLHPYTRGLLASVPRLGASLMPDPRDGPQGPAARGLGRLAEIPGTVPSRKEEIPGCPFAPRCSFATDVCRREMPPFEEKETGHYAACFHSDQVAAV